ncbi:YadA-like family protein [Pasteurella dagmatis]|uniref:Hep/Hag repeat protein n=1 Tax=Pasteurella dagmatis ATCC 43325 TaxID=667128 RepID=C9PR01_9PAST|nr:YadA-like family protein [Pasteurella dagmatis]EEX49902.1 Hep/Hag repeat protein [Pasteurella dagmatis ATCC 43325]SNV60316.1 autotransporter adhesin [Pasteurella dagmatis]
MNNIFKTIWNKSTQSWVAVSELARGYVKSSSAKKVSLEKNRLSKFSLSATVITLSIISLQTIAAEVKLEVSNLNIFTKGAGYVANVHGGNQKIAIGKNAQAGISGRNTNQSIAIGSGNGANDGAWAKGDQSIAIGGNTIAEGDSSIAIGGDDLKEAAKKQTNYIDNLGNSKSGSIQNAYKDLTGQDLDLSYINTKSQTLAVAIGVKANAQDLSLALGTNSKAGATNTVAIGSGATATLANSIAIGGGAIADGSNKGTKQSNVSIGKTNFTWAGGEQVLDGDIVSFGGKGAERQLKNIAPGKVSADSTDAVNGSQLYSIAKILTERSERNIYAHVNTGDNKQGAGNATTNEGQVDEKGGAIKTGAATFGLNATASAEHAVAIGTGANATHQNSVALGQGAKTSDVNTNDTMINFKNASYGNVTPNPTGTPTTANGSISFGSQGKERQLHNVAAGRITATSTDAINGSQLYHVAKNLGFNIYQGNTPKSRINNDSVVKFVDGTYTTAVVTSQNGNATVKFDVNVTAISDASTKTAQDYTVLQGNGLAKTSEVVTAINNSGFILKSSANVTGHAVTNGDSVTINKGKNIEIEQSGSNITIKTVDSPNFTSVTATDSIGVTSGPTINASGIEMMNKKLTGLEAGSAPNDAVNMGQLNQVKQTAETAKNTADVAKNTADVAKNTADVAKDTADVAKDTADVAKDTADAAKNTADAAKNTADVAKDTADVAKDTADAAKNTADTAKNTADEAKVLTEKNANKINSLNNKVDQGFTLKAAQSGSGVANDNNAADNKFSLGETLTLTAGDNVDITRTSSNFTIAISKTPTFTSVDINNGPTINTDGINMKDKKITGLKNGDSDTDAVNLSQLNTTKAIADAAKDKADQNSQVIDANKANITTLQAGWTIENSDASVSKAIKANNKVKFENSNNVNATVTNTTDGAILSFIARTADITTNTAGDIVLPTDEHALAKAKNVAESINNSGFIIEKQASSQSIPSQVAKVKNNHKVNFKEGNYTTVSVDHKDTDNRTNVTFDVVIQDIENNATSGLANAKPLNQPNKKGITTAESVANAINNAVSKSGFMLNINDEANNVGEKITPSSVVKIKQGDNILVTRNNSTVTIKTVDTPTFKDLSLKSNTNSTPIKLTSNDGNALTLGGGKSGSDPIKLTNIADAAISDSSKDAVTGKQLNDLAKKLGLTPTDTSFGSPNFTPIKGKEGNDGAIPTSFKDALDKITSGLNQGLTFGGDQGTSATQYLGSIYNVKATTSTISDNGKNFVGNNLKTYYSKDNSGNGLLSIGLSENPEFKSVVFKNGSDQVTVTPTADGLRFGKNVNTGADDSVKLTNLAEGNVSSTSKEAVTGKQLHATNERIRTLEGGWQIAGDSLTKVEDIKAGTNKVNFVNSTNIESSVTKANGGANVSFTVKTTDISVDTTTGAVTEVNDTNKLVTAKNVSQALKNVGWIATASADNGGILEGSASNEKVSSGNTVTFKAGKNLKIKQAGKEFTYSTLDEVNFTKVTATNSIGIENGPALSTTGLDMSNKNISGLADGEITTDSKEAITGAQLKDLADKLGITPNGKNFTSPTFNPIKDKDGNNGTTPTSFKDALDKLTEGINKGFTFGGDTGSATQYLGSRYNVKAAVSTISANGNTFIGKNLKTEYTNQSGDGLLSIGLSETPDFKSITLSDGTNNYLTLEKDPNDNSGKITGLTNRDATKNTDYGTNSNAGRAATEGAVKELSDRVKQSDNTSPFNYVDNNGNQLTKAKDGNFYPKDSVEPDGSVKKGEESKKVEPQNVVVKIKDATPMPITNVRSGLGLDGKSDNNDAVGTPSKPKAIGVDKAKSVITNLLTTDGANLNKVATVGDLQALAQAGLDFSGNVGTDVHRPLGSKLEILGKDGVTSVTGYSSDNLVTETANNKLYIKFKEKPEFKGITVKEGDDKPQIELNSTDGLVVKSNSTDSTPVKINGSGIDVGEGKISNLKDANIANDSKDAVTGKQLKDLADKLGVSVDTTNNTFAEPIFNEKIKDANGTDTNVVKPTTFKGAIDNIVSALNRGLSFIGDIGDGTQYLGSKFAVKATTDAIVDNTKNFVGKNLKTKYSITDGNGTLSIGLSETPDFKSITLTDGANATPYLTLGKDDAGNRGKITGLTNRTTDSNDYGTGDNVGRAATEGAVKKLSDTVNLNNDSSPMTYADAISGEKLVKGKDDKFYKPADLEGATYDPNSKIYTKNGRPVTSVTDVVVKSKDLKPMTNVASGLNPDKIGKVTDQTVYEPNKGIKPEAAINLISGADGLLTITDAGKLNKVATIGDLQAAAQAGLNFKANKGTDIHRSLGSTLSILGKEGVSDADIESKYSTENVVTEIKDDKLYVKIKDIPKLKGLELNSGEADAKSISMTPDKDGTKLKLSTSTAGKDSVTLDGIADGNIADGSKEAVTGNQLKDLAKNLGVGINPDGKNFINPTFASIKAANGTESTAPTTLKGAIDNTIEAVNRGLGFAGDEGNGNQNLGSTFNVKSTETVITKDNKNFVGKNITTRYVKDDATGNGTLSIGISERPDFKEITLSKDGDSKPFLTIGEDTDNTDKPTTGKITGLTARDLSSNGYGVGDNVGRAATEGAVKDLYDKVKSNEGSSPFEYRDEAGNKLVKVGDKYYSEKDLAGKHIVDGKIFNDPVVKKDDKYYVAGPDGKPKLGTDGQPIMTEATTATIKDKAPATASNKQLTDISNVRSGLGLDGKSETNSVDGSPAEPKAISVEKAKEVIAGKDGKSGLLTTEGAPLNKVATIGDLQAVAKAGLTFKGNNTDAEVHRPLGTTLDIKGEARESTGTSGKNVYVEANANDNSLTVKIKETPEFKGLELKDGNTNAIKFTPSDVANKDNPAQKEPVLTLSSGIGADNKPGTVKLSGISNGDISPTSKDAVNGSQVFALSRGEIPKIEDKQIIITQPDGSTTVIDAKNVIVDDKGNPLLKTYNVEGQGEHIENSVISAIRNMNTEGIKFFHTNDGRKKKERPQEQGLNEQDSSAGGEYATAVGYRANAAGMNGIAFGSDAVAGKILEEKEVTITERVNGKDVVTKRKVRVVEGVKNAIAIGAGARASNDNTISIGSGNEVNGKNSGAIGDPSYINADNAYAIGNNNKIETTSEKTFVLGNNVTVTTARSVFLGDAVGYVAADNKAGTTKGNAEYSEQKIGETTYKYAGGKANEVVGVVSVGNVKQDGAMETRRIQNVAPGLISDKSTDAINGSQLYAVMDSGWNLKAEEVDGTSGKVTKGKADTTKVSIGKTVKVRAGNNVEIAHNKDESIDISTSMAPTFNSLNVNPGGTVNMGGNRVQNVGNAVEAGDAVNYGQFKAEMGKLDSRLQAGIAGAVASGTLVQAFNPNESLVAVGAGTYRGKSAVALGYSRVSDNGKIIIKVTGSTNTYGDVTGGASVGYKF